MLAGSKGNVPSSQRGRREQVYCCFSLGAKSLLCSAAEAPTTTGSIWQMPFIPGRTEGFLKRVGLLVPRRELPCEQWLVGRAVLEAAPALLRTSCGAYGGGWLSTFSDLTPFLPLSSRLPGNTGSCQKQRNFLFHVLAADSPRWHNSPENSMVIVLCHVRFCSVNVITVGPTQLSCNRPSPENILCRNNSSIPHRWHHGQSLHYSTEPWALCATQSWEQGVPAFVHSYQEFVVALHNFNFFFF